jgi:hypothetical protein
MGRRWQGERVAGRGPVAGKLQLERRHGAGEVGEEGDGGEEDERDGPMVMGVNGDVDVRVVEITA